MKKIERLALAVALSVGMGVSGAAFSANFDEAMKAFDNQNYGVAFRNFSEVAMTGHRDAQFMLGYVYSKGYGTTQDYVQAHKWFNLAASQGDREARRARDRLTQFMSAQQISKAQEEATSWQPTTETPVVEAKSKAPAKSSSVPNEPLITWSNPNPVVADVSAATAEPSKTLTREEKRELQRRLRDVGYDPGPIDGLPGQRTLRAIRSYQSDFGLIVDGLVSREILEDLRTRDFAQKEEVEDNKKQDERVEALVEQLRELDRDGETRDLSNLEYKQRVSAILADFDRPWLTRVLYDNFRDGDYTLNPRWLVESGNFSIGSRDYLYSSVPVPRVTAGSEKKSDAEEIVGIFSDIFLKKTDKSDDREQFAGYAEIYSSTSISKSFSTRINLNGLLDNGRLNFGVYQGTSRINGYSISFNTGPQSSIALTRTASSGQVELGSIYLTESLTGNAHNVELRRNGLGKIEVALDDTLLFSATDTTLTGGFDGVVIGNHGGNFRVMEIEVYSEQ